MIYFDNAATAKVNPKVLETYVKLVDELVGNPSSVHGLGLKASNYMENARKQIGKTLKLKDKSIIFTSGASESNNLGIKGYVRRNAKLGNHIITTTVEHPSVMRVFEELETEGFTATYLSVDKDGQINLDELKKSLRPDTLLVSIMGVNNETGVIFPVEEIAKIIHKNSTAVFMSDLTQAIGKIELDLNIFDMFSMSSHKVMGLKSSGLFVYNSNLHIKPLIDGGNQEMGLIAGTDNAPLDCSLATAIRLVTASFEKRYKNATALKNYLVNELSKLGSEEILIISPKDNCSPFILNFSLLHYKASVLVEALSKRDVYVSTRSACSSHAKGSSYVIKALGYSDHVGSNAIRLSFEGSESLEQGKEFIKILLEEIEKLERI